MSHPGNNLPVAASRSVTTRDFLVFQVKLALDGVKDMVAISLSVLAIIIDLTVGAGRTRMFYGVVGLSERFERWLGLHRVKGPGPRELRGTGGDSRGDLDPDALLGADADDLIDRLEKRVRESGTFGRDAR